MNMGEIVGDETISSTFSAGATGCQVSGQVDGLWPGVGE